MTDNAPINWQKGVQYYGGDEDMFRLMIESYENLPFNNYMKQLYEHVLALDYQAIKTDAQSIKGVSTFIAAEKCQHFALELKNSATEENETKVIENYLALVKEGRALKTYIANITHGKFNAQDFEKFEKEIRKRYNKMTSSQFSNTEVQHQQSNITSQQMVTKKSAYAELKNELIEQTSVQYHNVPEQQQQQQQQQQQKEDCQFESVPPNPTPVCCTACNIF